MSRSRADIGLVVAIVVIDLFVVGGAWRSMSLDRLERYDEAARQGQNLARVLAENLEGSIRLLDLALREAKAGLEDRGRANPASVPDVERVLARLHASIPVVDGIRIAGPDGRVVHGVGPWRGPAVSIADRDYFLAAKAGSPSALFISEPVVSRFTGRRSLAIARRIDLAGGAFGGIVYAVLPVEQFARSLAKVDTGAGGAVVLRGSANALIARFPEPEDMSRIADLRRVTPQLAAVLSSGRSEANYVALSPIDGDEKVNSFRRVAGGPFYLLVATSASAFLASWRAEVLRIGVAVALFVLASAAAGALLLRTWRRERERRSADLKKALVEVKTLSGLLPICAHCKKIRDDRGYWNRIETFIRERSSAEFTHGICPECAAQFYPDDFLSEGTARPSADGEKKTG